MALFNAANYRAAHQGYAFYQAQGSQLVQPNATSDPSLQSIAKNWIGPVDFPGLNRNENFNPIEAIGSSRDMGFFPGRREADAGVRIQVADASFLEYAIRNRTDPDAAGTIKGLQMLAMEIGTWDDFGDGYAWQLLDSLINTTQITFAENSPVTATADLWPIVALEQPTPKSTITVPDANLLIWPHSGFDIAGTDYHPIVSRAQISINNGLRRVGTRQQSGALGSELEISRTPYAIIPTLEKLRVSYQLHDNVPDSLRTTADWGTVTMSATHPNGTHDLQIQIDQNYLNREGQQQTGANNILQFSADSASRAITITAS